ncbi:MAG: hypothetical protein ACTSRZ_14370 [Promethearchaeota archaeon]
MPYGLIIMQWDERIGVNILHQYPKDIVITEKTLMQIYSTHEYTSEAGLVSMNIGALNIGSYYTGPETGLYLVLLLNLEEDPDMFEDGLADAARIILENMENNIYKRLIPSIFQRLSVYPSLNEERRIAMIYADDVKRMIIKKLQKEGCMLKSEIAVWIRDQYKSGFVNLESVLLSLIRASVIKSVSVKGTPSETIFLIKDIYITRAPPAILIKDAVNRGLPANLVETYKNEIYNFFANYKNDEQDNLDIINVLLDPPVYETLTLLRQAIVTRDDLEKLQKKGVDDVDDVLKKLWKAKMIVVLQDDAGNEYYALQSDIKIISTFPEWQLNLIREQYNNKTKSNLVLIEYVNILKEIYEQGTLMKKEKKKTKKEKSKREVEQLV